MTKSDPPEVRRAVQRFADQWPDVPDHACLHEQVIIALERYAKHGYPRDLDLTVFRTYRDAVVAGEEPVMCCTVTWGHDRTAST